MIGVIKSMVYVLSGQHHIIFCSVGTICCQHRNWLSAIEIDDIGNS